MKKKLVLFLSSILFIAPIAMTNAANSNDGDGTPIPIHEIDPKNNIPRSPVLVPISASLQHLVFIRRFVLYFHPIQHIHSIL